MLNVKAVVRLRLRDHVLTQETAVLLKITVGKTCTDLQQKPSDQLTAGTDTRSLGVTVQQPSWSRAVQGRSTPSSYNLASIITISRDTADAIQCNQCILVSLNDTAQPHNTTS